MVKKEEVLKFIAEENINTLSKKMRKVKWEESSVNYELFLQSVPLDRYRDELTNIKIVEENLSQEFRSFHLSLIYHLYWKNKFVVLKDNTCPHRLKRLKSLIDFLQDKGGRVELYKILGKFNFSIKEYEFLKWFYFDKNHETIQQSISLEQNFVTKKLPDFEEFWSIYKENISWGRFLETYNSYFDISKVKKGIVKEARSCSMDHCINSDLLEEILKNLIRVGLKARMYRIWASVLTQLDWAYKWNRNIPESGIDSDASLDEAGIDAYGRISGDLIGFDVKKESQRKLSRRDVNNDQAILMEEVRYILDPDGDKFFNGKLKKLDNSFIIFTDEYVKTIYQKISSKK